MNVKYQTNFAIFSLVILFGISIILYLYKVYSCRKKPLKHLNYLSFLLILASCILYLFNSLISITYITNVFRDFFPFLLNLLMLASIFISIFLYFNILVVFNKENINELKSDNLNGNKEAEIQYEKKYKFFKIFKKKIVKYNSKDKAALNNTPDRDMLPINKAIGLNLFNNSSYNKENATNEDKSLEELKKWIKNEIKEKEIQKDEDID